MASYRKTDDAASGSWGTVEYAIRQSGKCLGKAFVTSMDRPAQAKFIFLFQEMANEGKVQPKRFKFEGDGIYTFRFEISNRQIRFPCFEDGNKWIITHGFFKKGGKQGVTQWRTEKAKAIDIRHEYFSV